MGYFPGPGVAMSGPVLREDGVKVTAGCENLEKNKEICNCSYDPCPRKGKCCECLQYHLAQQQLPACCFPDEVERSWDRSFKRFCAVQAGN